MKYQLIDYRVWKLSRLGPNIAPFLTKEEGKIWEAALPWQDSRDDPGQGEMVTYFTLKLLEEYPAQREIAVPAAILHDIGWKGINPQVFREAVKANKDHDLRVMHQEKGAALAKDILRGLNYFPDYIQPILKIISDHDTRIHEPSLEGKVMMDADILWRFTLPCKNAYHNESLEEIIQYYQKELSTPYRFYLPVSEEIACLELVNTLFWCFPQASSRLKDYTPQLKKIREHYT